MRNHNVFLSLLASTILATQLSAQPSELGAPAQLVAESDIQGGLVVHVGCKDVAWTAGLRVNERYLVQGLGRNAETVGRARRHLLDKSLSGPVSVRRWSGGQLPYADNLVSLLVVDEGQDLARDEVMRVLSPRGVAYTRVDGTWQRISKPWPEEIDEWTHYLHGPDNNAVADDTRVAPPHHLQWTAGPRWGRSHDQLESISASVSAAGRIFYIVDEGSIAAVNEPARWMLVARDAFNGVLLWKKPIGPWEDQMRTFRSGPAELPRRLVAVENHVYVTLGYGQSVSVLDAATGEQLDSYEETRNAQEIVVADGRVYVVVGQPPEFQPRSPVPELPEWLIPYPQTVQTHPPRHLVCLDQETGRTLWKRQDQQTKHLLPLTTAVSGGRLFYHNQKNLVALDAASGETLWTVARPISLHRYAWSVPTLVVQGDVVLSADRTSDEEMDLGGDASTTPRWLVSSGHDLFGGQIIAFSATSGEQLWTAPCHESFNAPVDLFVARDQVWSGQVAWPEMEGIERVYDLQTGQVTANRPPDSEFGRFGHHRCYRAKATVNYVLHSRRGIEFVDMDSDQLLVAKWLRGACQYGILPCNGMIYTPPHSCACSATHQISSFNALAARSSAEPQKTQDTVRLEKGPAYEEALGSSRTTSGNTSDWPTYRHDAARSGATSEQVSSQLATEWQEGLGGRLTPPVIADGRLFVAQPRTHTLFALDVNSGERLWSYSGGAPIDSPPTIFQGFAYFGSADGWVYCLRASDGRLAWRYRAAPGMRQIVSYDRVESVWPLHGSLLVRRSDDGSAIVHGVAGRSTYVDDGMVLFQLDAVSGRLLSRQRLYCPSPESKKLKPPVDAGSVRVNVLPDVLATDGSHLFMRAQAFDFEGMPLKEKIPHLFSATGFLDDTWWHRTYWQFGTDIASGYSGWIGPANSRISGRLLVGTEDRVFGFGRKEYFKTGSHFGMDAEHHLFAATKAPLISGADARRTARDEDTPVGYDWSVDLPMQARALVLSGEHLLAAGPNNIADLHTPEPSGDAWLRVVSAANGQKVAEYPISSSPVLDGMAVSRGRVFLVTVDGRVTCFASR